MLYPLHLPLMSLTSSKYLTIYRDPCAMVTFLIGNREDPTKFLVHKEVACRRSPVLDVAFNSQFEEGRTQTYYLDDISVMAFRYFMQ
jgi:hypothetical protein